MFISTGIGSVLWGFSGVDTIAGQAAGWGGKGKFGGGTEWNEMEWSEDSKLVRVAEVAERN
ncbi:hypothetical protein [Mangrovibacterium sp.]|uniref:hypothetical protein n=1 Tax=Mangrovibacterium sp. TaxID=1961364 RepID=UPI003569FB71